MTLGEKQRIYTFNFAKLIIEGYRLGFQFSLGEAHRMPSMVLLNFYGYEVTANNGVLSLVKTSPKSKTLESLHTIRLATDVNIFKDGRLLFSDPSHFNEDLMLVKPLGEYWVSLNTSNRWGGDFDKNGNPIDDKFHDPGHFEMKP